MGDIFSILYPRVIALVFEAFGDAESPAVVPCGRPGVQRPLPAYPPYEAGP
jgi:hypothetical protein